MVASDLVALPVCMMLALWLVRPGLQTPLPLWASIVPIAIGLPVLHLCGFYRSVIRFMGLHLLEAALKSTSLIALVLLLGIATTANWDAAARVSITFWFLGIVYIVGSRLAVRWLLHSRSAAGDRHSDLWRRRSRGPPRIGIDGTAENSFPLLSWTITRHCGTVINGLEVHSPASCPAIIDEFGVSRVLAGSALGVPSSPPGDHQSARAVAGSRPDDAGHRRIWFRETLAWTICARSISRIFSVAMRFHRYRVSSMPASEASLFWSPGAGGSIGSELCTQIAQLGPKRLDSPRSFRGRSVRGRSGSAGATRNAITLDVEIVALDRLRTS